MVTFRESGSKIGSLLLLGLCGAGCAAADPSEAMDGERVGEVRAASAVSPNACVTGLAAGGWSNDFIPQSTGTMTLTFRVYPSGVDENGHPLIDGLVGLSNGPSQRFSDLGPIVRFNSNGSIDARDGDHYVGGFPYITYEPFEAKMAVDITTRRYTVWVRHTDAINKPFELLGSDLAFRTEQQGVSRLDSAGVFIDSHSGQLQACGFRYDAPDRCAVSTRAAGSASSWQSRAFPPRSGHFKLEFDATPTTHDGSSTLDAVVGAASGAPSAFSKLAAALRFRPDGKLDVRNGATYAADQDFAYTSGTGYQVSMDIDAERGRYSVAVKQQGSDPSLPPVMLAQDYGFRTEQAATNSFDHLGQFIDAGEGELQICSLTVVY